MGKLSLHTWQHSIGRVAGYLRILAQDGVGDVKDKGVLSHLLEDLALVDESPDHAPVVVVQLVLVLVLLIPSQIAFNK